MTQHRFRLTPITALLAALVGAALLSARLAAEPAPTSEDARVTKLVCALLQRQHLNKPKIDDEMSRRLFRRFLKDLDPAKGYFLKADVEEFQKSETELDDQLLQGDASFAYDVFKRFVQRVEERQKLIDEMINAHHDFTVKENLSTDYDALDYATTENDLRERWRKRIKFDLLLHRIGQKPLPDAEARKKVHNRYQSILRQWKQLDNFELLELYLTGLTGCADPHSSYMSPSTVDDFDISLRLHLDGIGALLRSDNGQTIVAEVIPGGAAAKDGRLKVNDKIIAVAQGDNRFVDVVDMKLREVVKLIRGRRGTPVQLKVVSAEKIEPKVFDLTRQNIELKGQEARGEVIEQGKKADGTPYRIGVIDLPSFYADTKGAEGEAKSATEDVRKLLHGFNDKHVDGVILDLRRNGGGVLREAIALTGLFIDEGAVVQVRDSRGAIERGKKEEADKGMAYGGPLMVLVSRFSASASEILAGALQDYGRALIVGDSSTHGKGTVQVVRELGNLLREDPPPKIGAIKLTVQQFYRVNGDSTQNRGVVSDVVIPSLSEYLSNGEKELDNALAFDHIDPVTHDDMGMVPADVKAAVRARSAERVKKSADFAKLAKDIELLKARKARKIVPLNEQELKAQFSKDEADKAEKLENGLPPEAPPDAKYKFQRNFTNNEVLQIMEDFLQGRKLAQAR